MIKDINRECEFHSFVTCRTVKVDLAQRLPYTILTKEDIIITSPEDENAKFQFNFAFDAVKYAYNNQKLVLAEGQWFKDLISQDMSKYENQENIIDCRNLKILNDFKFYFYLKEESLILVKPLFYLSQSTLIFDGSGISQTFKSINDMNNLATKYSSMSSKILSFTSEYALLSDPHFLNTLVESYKPISCYVKYSEGYAHTLDKEVYHQIQILFGKINL